MFPMRHRTRQVGSASDAARPRASTVFALAIYLVAWAAPGLGTTVAWIVGRAYTGDPLLDAHHRRALLIQVACVGAMLTIQGAVVAILASGFPWGGPPELRWLLVLAGLHLTAGIHLAMGLLGPLLRLGERRRAPIGGGVPRVAPSRPPAPSRPSISTSAHARPRVTLGERTTRRVGAAGGVASAG